MSDSVWPHRRQPTRLPHPWDSLGKNTGVGCHFLLQCMKVKSQSEVTQLCPTLSDPMDCSLPGSSVHGIFQARVLEWGAIALRDPPKFLLLLLWWSKRAWKHLLMKWWLVRLSKGETTNFSSLTTLFFCCCCSGVTKENLLYPPSRL